MLDRIGFLVEQLNSPVYDERRAALAELAKRAHSGAASQNFNLHFHSFFSFNAEGWSPSRIVYEARRAGLYAAGLCDFDVLDGLDEFYRAGLALGVRTTVHLETRAFMRDYASVEINSPGEPGVAYVMGAGFAEEPEEGTAQAAGLAGFRERARARNLALISRINPHVPQIALDYERDVLPLTPAGVATERHIVRAYVLKAREYFGRPEAVARFWSGMLGRPYEETVVLLADPAGLEELVRARFVKRGGLGYEQPSPDSFPPIEEFIRWTLSCGAMPMITWLDGMSEGEKNGRAMLQNMVGKGACALNIIPDRNWRISDPAARARKVAALREIVAAADSMDLPINIGTEMNRHGLPFVDDLDGPVLSEFKRSFIMGANVMVGQALLHRYADFSYVGSDAQAAFPDRASRNRFFGKVGALPPLDERQADRLEEMGPEKAFDWFSDRTRELGVG